MFYSSGLQFTCQRCSHCCRHESGYVYLSLNDIENLSSFLSISKKELIQNYCRVVPYHDGTEVYSLLEKQNYDCIFWDGGCTLYGARPIQCSTYPFWTYIVSSKERWDQESQSCPGINFGKLLKKDEICDIVSLYTNNKPVVVSDIDFVED